MVEGEMVYRFRMRLPLAVALFVISATLFVTSAARAANDNPVILVHGFGGFGRNELLGYKYWGGFEDLETQLNESGRTTYTAVMGPLSSDWDRAVELYYQIKGGCVDYGEAHSDYFGHAQTVPEKCFPGLYPQWSEHHPVHLVTHSMGGSTAKMLVHLLESGGAPLEPGLFGGKKSGWITSLTTIASPNNGTSLADVVSDHVPFVVDLVAGVAALAGISSGDNLVYNFKMEQWGLRRAPREGFISYRNRVKDSSIWTDPIARLDLSLWSLSPDGAREQNEWVETWSNVYYYSYATKTTYREISSRGWEFPLLSTNPLTVVFSTPAPAPLQPGMGNYTSSEPGSVLVDASWWANDAVVNTKSMKAPDNASTTVVDYNGRSERGKWNYMGLFSGFDHFDVLGWLNRWDAQGFYSEHIDRLKSL
jgi:triacylglycerol lipase